MVPGMSIAQWICTRVIMQSIRTAVSASRFLLRQPASGTTPSRAPLQDDVTPSSTEESNRSSATAYKNAIKAKLWNDGGGDGSVPYNA